MVLNTEWAQVEVIDLINDGSGLAFGIIGGRSTGVVVKTILPGGVADRDGRLQSGDHILQIGEVNLRGLGSEQVASVLRQCGIHVRMVVARPIESVSADYQALRSRATVVPTKILGDPVELDKHLIENGYIQSPIYHPRTINPIIYSQSPSIQLHPISEVVDVVRNPRPIGSVPVLKLGENDLPETETYAVVLKKDDLGLGVTVAGYVCEREDISGIFVKSISKGGAADATKKIQVNDRIIEVDGECVIGHTNHHAVELLRNTGPTVRLKLERYLRGPKYESLQQAIKANEYRPPSPPSVTASSLPKVPLSDVRMSYMEIEPEGESRTSFDFDSTILFDEGDKEIVIGGEGFNLRDNESIHDKWQKVLGKQAVILIDKIFKESNSGLGISLEGTVEVEDGKELHPRHYIRNILPDGPVGRNEVLQVGDELLEVNGVHLTGLNHLEVVNIFKKLPSYVKLVCARYPVPIRIIDTSQKREAFQSRKIFTGSLQTLVPCSDLLVKAKSESSIASSVASEFCSRSRSRSLELIAGLPMWSNEPTVVELVKGGFGLGFSVLDYQDPLNPQKTVIVIRSLVPGGTAQQDGRLIPGDRLLAVNDINVEHASLDLAVSVLKGVPKGPVRLRVAKPLTINDPVPYTSQDSEEDRTYLDDFQECFEEYQECLDENPMCTDQLNCASRAKKLPDALENNNLLTVTSDNSDLDLSFKSVQEKPKIECKISRRLNLKTDSWTQSQSSNQDGYDTCVEEESLSEEAPRRSVIEEEVTPTNSRGEPANLGNSTSEPCLLRDNRNVLCLDSKNDGLKSYQDDSAGPDEFFLIQYQVEIPRSYSESSVFDRSKLCFGKKFTFHLEEYYNDYEECLNSINVEKHRLEMGDEIIFDEIILPFKCRSVETLFVERLDLETARRKSDFAGQQGEDRQMTVIKSIGNECGAWKGDQMLQKRWGSIHTVQIHREINSGLGITIVGGKVDLEGQDSQRVVGIFVKDVVAGSTAGKTGLFKTGDRILEVSGVDLREATHERAVEAIRSAPDPVVFVIQSLSPWEAFDKPAPDAPEDAEQVAQKHDEIVPGDQKGDVPVLDGVINESFRDDSLEESEEEEDVRELEGRTVTTKGQQIDRASAGNVKRTKEEISQDGEEEDDFGYTSNKVKKKYANLGSNIFIVQLERSNQGLGLSLAGHKDRNCMAVFVCGLNPNGAAYKAGGIQIGDEILEVNGVVLHGRCHLNASAIIKSLSGPIFKVIILRRKTAINDIAVKPITQFPVSLAEEASEEQFSASYPNVRTVSVKKGNQSLGIMIIEGKHAEVGQGIFISDIQEGSAAEKAGLEIGEMILAVNKDSLVGSNYETAANLLKRTEGLVTLVVSNPGKRDQSRQTAPLITQCTNNTANTEANRNAGRNAVLKSAGPTSRPATPVPEANVDLAACSVTPGRDVTIEVVTDNKGLGIFFVGGKDTLLSGGIVVVEVYPGGMADQDGRLKPGDQILDVNGTSLKDVTTSIASQALRQTLPKMKMIVYRPERVEYTKLDIDLIKKPGKGLGLSVIARKSGKGVYISDIINGGSVDVDGRIMRGDLLISVNGQSVENCSGDEACVILKTVTGKISLKLHRYKIVAR